jgi:hypothetical protein
MNQENLHSYWQENVFPHGSPMRNMSVYWSGTDSKENFLLNPRKGYTETSIVYNYNSYGFRTPEFNLESTRPKLFFLGCSHVEGIGLREEDTLAYKVFKHYPDYDCYNLGIGGSSGDTVARTLTNICGLLTPSIVYILWPDISRFELYEDNNKCNHMGTWSLDRDNVRLFHTCQQFQTQQKNKLIIKLLQDKYKFKISETCVEDHLPLLFKDDHARDEHFGPRAHSHLAKFMVDHLKKFS